jgi:hypothetical protein
LTSTVILAVALELSPTLAAVRSARIAVVEELAGGVPTFLHGAFSMLSGQHARKAVVQAARNCSWMSDAVMCLGT